MTAMSPRVPPPRLTSTVKEKYGTPRKNQSVLQSVALSRGYTVRAGAFRRSRLQKSPVVPTPPEVIDTPDVAACDSEPKVSIAKRAGTIAALVALLFGAEAGIAMASDNEETAIVSVAFFPNETDR